MAFAHGKNTVVMFDYVDFSRWFRNATKSAAVEAGDTTCFGVPSGSKTFVPGLNDGTISLEGFYDGAVGLLDSVINSFVANSSVGIYTIGPDGVSPGSRVWMAEGPIVSWETSSPIADVVTTNCEVQASGGVLHGVSLQDTGIPLTATGTGTVHDSFAASFSGGVGHFHVVGNSWSANVDVKIQHSVDNAVWADLITFPTVTAAGRPADRIAVGGTINRWLRTSYTLTAGTGAIQFGVALARR